MGEDLEKMNFWMDKDIENSTNKSHDTEQIIQGIYCFIRKNFSCTSHSGIFPRQRLKETFKSRSGSVADINFLLLPCCGMPGSRQMWLYSAPGNTVDESGFSYDRRI